jgi:hypothetical protein
LAEPYQVEFEALTQGETPGTPEPTPEVQTKPEEFIEFVAGEQKYKIPTSAEFSYKHAGTMNKSVLSQVLNRIRQESHLDTKMSEYKKMKEEIDQRRGEDQTYQSLRQKYEAIQKWSEENPDQWERLYGMWQGREKSLTSQGPTDPNNQLLEYVRGMEGRLKKSEEFMTNYERQQEETKMAQDMKEVENEIEQFSKEFKEIDLNEQDEEGIPLKSRIISFGVQHRIPDFESAALKYLKPRLLEVAQLRARNEVVKGVKSDKQQGIVSRSATPQGKGPEFDPRKLSWEKLGELARAEFKP